MRAIVEVIKENVNLKKIDNLVLDTIYEIIFTSKYINDKTGVLKGPYFEQVEENRKWYVETEKEELFREYKDFLGNEYKQKAYYLANGDSKKTMLVSHGFSSASIHMGGWCKIFYDMGYNILTPDLRGHGTSMDINRNFGAYDTDDILFWVEVLKNDKSSEEISIFGDSMGASIMLQVASNNELPKEVVSIISDCGYSSLPDFIKSIISQIPLIPEEQKNLIYNYLNDKFKSTHGKDFYETLTLDKIKNISIPLLIINGLEDIPFLLSAKKIFEVSIMKLKKFLYVAGAGHPVSILYDYDKYKSVSEYFLSKGKTHALISLEVNTKEIIEKGSDFDKMKGAFAFDYEDGNITTNIQVEGDVDVSIVGEYNLSYSIINTKGNITREDKIVEVK